MDEWRSEGVDDWRVRGLKELSSGVVDEFSS